MLLTPRKFIDPGIYIIERISGKIKSKHLTIQLTLIVKVNTDCVVCRFVERVLSRGGGGEDEYIYHTTLPTADS